MKIYPTDYEIFGLIYLPFWIVLSFAYVFACQSITSSVSAHWLIAIFLIPAAMNPKYKIRLTCHNKKKSSVAYWLLQLFTFQLSLYFLFRGFTDLLIVEKIQAPYVHSLFPWDLYALFGVTLGYTLTKKNTRGLLSSLVRPWFHNSYDDSVGVITDSYARLSAFTSLCLIATTCTLILSLAIPKITYGNFDLSTTMCTSFLILVATSKFYRQTIRILLNFLPPIIVTLLSIATTLATIFVIYPLAKNYLPHAQKVIFEFSLAQRSTYASLLLYTLMLNFSILASAYSIHISQGYSIRSMLLAQMILPLLFLTVNFQIPNTTLLILTLLSCFFLMGLFIRKKYLTHIFRATMPGKENIKNRPPYIQITSLAATTMLFVAVFLNTGPVVLGYIIFVMAIPITLLILLCITYHPGKTVKNNQFTFSTKKVRMPNE